MKSLIPAPFRHCLLLASLPVLAFAQSAASDSTSTVTLSKPDQPCSLRIDMPWADINVQAVDGDTVTVQSTVQKKSTKADHLPLEKLMFEVVSAFAKGGLSTGITAELPPAAQGVIIALMYVGRVGVVTLALALAINQIPRAYRYPEEKPIVG